MGVSAKAGAAGLSLVVALLTGCIAPDVEVIGALGVTVDGDQRPVLMVEACDGAVTRVELFFDREGLADDEENEQLAAWTTDTPVGGTSELVLSAPGSAWTGGPVEVDIDRGYVATGAGEGEDEILSQVAFRGRDLAAMEPGTVYVNDSDPDVRELHGRSSEEFTAEVCSQK